MHVYSIPGSAGVAASADIIGSKQCFSAPDGGVRYGNQGRFHPSAGWV